MRVLLLTQLFQPEPNFLKGLEYAKAVRNAGVDLRVLTGFPNYPGGRLYEGYGLRPLLHEELEGVPVTRAFVYPSHDRSVLRRAATYLTFAGTSALAACLDRFRPDVVHVYVGPITLAIPAAVARAARGARVLLDVQDLWPESFSASGMSSHGRIERMVGKLSQWAYRTCDRIVVLSEGYKLALCDRGVPADRIHVIYNWCDESQVPDVDVRSDPTSGNGRRLRVLYAGNVGGLQALDVVLDAALLLGKRDLPVEFLIAGSGVESERLRARQQTELIPGVRFLGRVPRQNMTRLYEDADALLVHLRDAPLCRIAIPQKTQVSLAAGRPVLVGVRGETTRLVCDARAGLAFEPESPASLAEAVATLCEMPERERRAIGERARRLYTDRLSFTRGVREMLRVYEAMA